MSLHAKLLTFLYNWWPSLLALLIKACTTRLREESLGMCVQNFTLHWLILLSCVFFGEIHTQILTILPPSWFSLSSRSARGDDLCSFHPRHSNLRPPDDVFHHSSNCLLHCLDLWRWHHAHAVLHEHTVRLHRCLCCFYMHIMWLCSRTSAACLFSFRVGVDSDQDHSVSN